MSSPEWIQKRIKAILFHYGENFFKNKKVLDVGSGHGEVSIAFANLGAIVTAIDARKNFLDILKTKNPAIRCTRADLDQQWPFNGEFFDVVLHLGTLNHLKEIELNLKNVCHSASHLILDTQVCDSTESDRVFYIKENKSNTRHSANGTGARASAKYIEGLLSQFGMEYEILTDDRCNSGEYIYDWRTKNSNSCREGLSRLWFAKRHSAQSNSSNQIYTNKGSDLLISPSATPTPISARSVTLTPFKIHSNTGTIIKGQKRFVIVIPSYKNAQWCERNITSTIIQNYDKYRVIFTDDASTDGTFEKVKNVVNSSNKASKFTLIKNDVRIGALANLYNMIHSCDDDEIILTLDGDDWLSDENVLIKLNEVYSASEVWMTYGQYQNYPDNGVGIASRYPQYIVDTNSFRKDTWRASHLRTFYTWLFKKIRKQDLFYNGDFMKMTWDLAMELPMLEISGNHSKFISDILYIYNLDNPINDHKVDVAFQQKLDHYVRELPRYPRLETSPLVKPITVGLSLIATGKYDRFVEGFISSADKYFLPQENVTYYLFTDKLLQIESKRTVVQILIEHRPFPFASADRFKHFTANSNKFENEDYIYYADVDSLFVDGIGIEIIGDLVGVKHCGFLKSTGPYETNSLSTSYIDPAKYKYYFGGGMSGGRKRNYLALAKWCYEAFEKDIANGVMPKWHDESVINKYFSENEPDVILSPEFHYPSSGIERYKKMWAPEVFRPKVLLLDKNHEEIRR